MTEDLSNAFESLLRQAFRTNLERDDHDRTVLASATRSLNQRLTGFLSTQKGIWAGFEPVGFEPDIRTALSLSTHIRWAFPRVEHETLKFYEVRSRDELVKNQWHIWEPDPTLAKPVAFDELHGLLIPGLAFDQNGNRLGRGRGFYDRALADINQTTSAAERRDSNQPLKVGIALDRQVSEQSLPHDAHDIAMDLVITESRTLRSHLSSAPLKGIL